MLKMLTYLVSERSCSHFSGGSTGGIRNPHTVQQVFIIYLFEYLFHNLLYCPQWIHLYHYYNRISILYAFVSFVSVFLLDTVLVRTLCIIIKLNL